MKKQKILIFASLILCLSILFLPTKVKTVSADSDDINKVAVIGVGEYITQPDTAQIRFTSICVGNSIKDCLDCSDKNLQNIKNALSEIDENIDKSLFIENGSIRPICERGIQKYENRQMINIKTSKLDKVNEILSVLSLNEALVHNNITYCLEDYQPAYNEALKIAKQNAENKAEIFGSDLTLINIFEEYCYICNYSCESNSIKIEARVKAIFGSKNPLQTNELTNNKVTDFDNEQSEENTILQDNAEEIEDAKIDIEEIEEKETA